MSTANYSINFSAVLSSLAGNVVAYTAACRDASGYLTATASARAASPSLRAEGVFLGAGSSGESVPVMYDGVIQAGLGTAATVQPCIVSATGALVRSASPLVTDDVIGQVLLNGDVRVQAMGTATPTATTGTLYVLSASSAAASPGDWACLVPSDPSGLTLTRATPVAVAAAGGVAGVFPFAYAPGATSVVLLTTGTVGVTYAGVGAGAAGAVALGSNATAVRSPLPHGGEYWLGTVDTAGNVTIAPSASIATSPHHVLNAKAYGAVGDNATDDTAAIQSMLNSGVNSADIHLPAASYYCADNLFINRPCRFFGVGGSASNNWATHIRFAAGKGLIVNNAGMTQTVGGSGVECIIENLFIECAPLNPATWTANTAKNVGDIIAAPHENRWYWECIKAGTTGSTIPAINAASGANIPELSKPWTASTYHWAGKVVYPTGVLANLVFFACTTAGQGSGTQPSWNFADLSTTNDGAAVWTAHLATGVSASYWAQDGTVYWACRVHAGIWFRGGGKARDNHIYGATCAGVHAQGFLGYYPPTNTSESDISNNRLEVCGLGVATVGSDSNAIRIFGNKISNPGYWRITQSGSLGGVGVWDGATAAAIGWNDVESQNGPSYIGGVRDLGPTPFREWMPSQAVTSATKCTPRGVGNNRVYQAGGSGTTSASTEPTWPAAGLGNTIGDNGITWTDVGTINDNYGSYLDAQAAFSTVPKGSNFTSGYEEPLSGHLPSVSMNGTISGTTHANGWQALSNSVRITPSDCNNWQENDTTSSGASLLPVARTQALTQGVFFALYSVDDPSYPIGYRYNHPNLGRAGWYSRCVGPNQAGRSFSGEGSTEGAGWDWLVNGEFRGGHSANTFADQYFFGADSRMLQFERLRKKGLYAIGDRFDLQGTGVAGTSNGWIVASAGQRGPHWLAGLQYAAGVYPNVLEPTAYGLIPPATGFAYECTTTGFTGATEPNLVTTRWTTGLAVTSATKIIPSHSSWIAGSGGQNRRAYQASGVGTTGTGEPVWPAPVLGNTVADGGFTWTDIGPAYAQQAGETMTDPLAAAPQGVFTARAVPTYTRIGLCIDPGGTLTTTSNTAAQVLASFALADVNTDYVRVLVTANQATGDGATFELRGAWRRNGGAPVVVKAAAVTESNPNTTGTAWTAVLALSGNNVQVQVTGDTSKTIVWRAIRLDQERQG